MNVNLYANMMTVALLMAIGKLIKSSRFCKDIPNDLIPYILIVVGIAYQFILDGFSNIGNTIASGIISSSVAVGLHQSGKKLFINNTIEETTEDENENVG